RIFSFAFQLSHNSYKSHRRYKSDRSYRGVTQFSPTTGEVTAKAVGGVVEFALAVLGEQGFGGHGLNKTMLDSTTYGAKRQVPLSQRGI
ncbi:MAG: hypothetical protein IJY45_05620, partial [Tidjanibacter sp.]|nr:hypothetical protein [Tidjanibacter sp.]